MKRHQMSFTVVASIVWFFSACVGRNQVVVKVSADVRNVETLSEVYVTLGSEKLAWPLLAPGRTVSARIAVNASEELTLLYRVGGKELDWRGPAINPAEVKEIDIQLLLSSTPQVNAHLVPR